MFGAYQASEEKEPSQEGSRVKEEAKSRQKVGSQETGQEEMSTFCGVYFE